MGTCVPTVAEATRCLLSRMVKMIITLRPASSPAQISKAAFLVLHWRVLTAGHSLSDKDV